MGRQDTDGSMTRKEMEIEARKKDIIDAAAKLFSEKEFHDVKVDDIAERVGLSKGTIYLYFKNKENLFYSIVWKRMRSLLKCIKQTLDCESSYEECLRRFIRTYLSFYAEHQAFFKIIHSEKMRMSADEHYKFHRYAKETFADFFQVVDRIIRKGQAEDALRPVDPGQAARYLIGVLNAFTFQRVIFGATSSVESDVKFVMDVFMNGVRVSPDR